MKKLFMLILCLFLLISCNTYTEGVIDYIPYADIPKDYSLDDARVDNIVIYENSDITSGQSIWDNFVEKAQKGVPCMVRLGFYFTIDDPSRYEPNYYEEIKNDYPVLYIQDLTYDGNEYTLYSIEEGKEVIYKYKYLKRFNAVPTNNTATYFDNIRYVLISDIEVTWNQIFHGMISSNFNDRIDHKTVYTKYIYDSK